LLRRDAIRQDSWRSVLSALNRAAPYARGGGSYPSASGRLVVTTDFAMLHS